MRRSDARSRDRRACPLDGHARTAARSRRRPWRSSRARRRSACSRPSPTAGRRSACSSCAAGPPDEQTVADVALAAHALAYVVIANRRFTDLFAWGQRSVPLSLAAEIQHRLLPGSYTCEAGQFTLAAWLEPAGNVGGDTFDFALERDTLHLSMTDAMGHEVDAAVLATVLVGALRNARRPASGSPSRRACANAGLADFAAPGRVRHRAARADGPRAQTATIVNAGHPPPLRLRDGRVERLPLTPTRRSGSSAAIAYQRADAAARAGRPADVPHRRHAGAQRRRRRHRGGARRRPRRCTRAKPSSTCPGHPRRHRREAARRRDGAVPRLARRPARDRTSHSGADS